MDLTEEHPFAERQLPFPADHALVEASRCLYCYDAPCMVACPTSIDIPGFIRSIATGDDLGASDTIFRSNVLGASCGRVCETEALCEGSCVLGPTGKPIEIGRLQRHATDAAWSVERPIPYASGADSGKSVAIIGGGPAGLSAAANLREQGHAVTIFERMPELGGLARYGIIPVREPNPVIEWEVAQVLALGVDVHTNVEVGRDVPIEEITGAYDAVLLTVGAGRYVFDIDLDGAPAKGVEDALLFIERSRTMHPGEIPVGRDVVVVGGGNTAMDAATIAVQLNVPRVTTVYRRTADDMTAYRGEYEFCLHKGVVFEFLTQPIAVETDADGHVTGLVCVDVIPGAHDESGRPRPQLGTERRTIPCDHVLLATGQAREPNLFELFEVPTLPDGRAEVDELFAGGPPGLWACGDAVTTGTQLSVVDAVAQGKVAAASIHAALVPTLDRVI